jgi:hypothetical protein
MPAVARFYRGVGVGSYHYSRDLRLTGLSPANVGGQNNATTVMHHIAWGTITSPYISLTKSYGVAEDYARNASRVPPTPTKPAHVYEMDIPVPPPHGVLIIDPLYIIAAQHQNPLTSKYHHDGNQDFLLGVVNRAMATGVTKVRHPPGMGGAPRFPNLSVELEALTYVLRDAEVLVVGNLPTNCFTNNRYDIF